MAFGIDMKIERGPVVMDAGVQRSRYFLHHIYTVTACLVMDIIHKNSNFVFFACQWVRQRIICDITEFAVCITSV
jgi:hypothetical protein